MTDLMPALQKKTVANKSLLRQSTPSPVTRRRRSGALERILRDRFALMALLVIAAVLFLAAAAPLLPIPDPNRINPAARLSPPLSDGHLLGTDQLGRDLLSRVIWGGRVSLTIAGAAAILVLTAGLLLGTVAGFFGRLTDSVIMRGMDGLMAFPTTLLALALIAALGPSVLNLVLAIAIVNVAFFTRWVRGITLTVRSQGFVEAAMALGASPQAILFRHLLPNIIPACFVAVALNVGWMMIEAAGLSFLGLGTQPPTADWGTMLADGRQFLTVAPHIAVVPGAAIMIVVLCCNIVADGVRDVLDPRLGRRL